VDIEKDGANRIHENKLRTKGRRKREKERGFISLITSRNAMAKAYLEMSPSKSQRKSALTSWVGILREEKR